MIPVVFAVDLDDPCTVRRSDNEGWRRVAATPRGAQWLAGTLNAVWGEAYGLGRQHATEGRVAPVSSPLPRLDAPRRSR